MENKTKVKREQLDLLEWHRKRDEKRRVSFNRAKSF